MVDQAVFPPVSVLLMPGSQVASSKSEVSLDTSISVDGDSNVFAETDPIPGVDVKLGQNK